MSPTRTSTGLVDYLGVPRIQIEEVLSFYTQFRRKPIGRWHIQVVPQHLVLAARARSGSSTTCSERLGIAPGETTRRRPLHAVDRRVPRRLRHRAGADGQRHATTRA